MSNMKLVSIIGHEVMKTAIDSETRDVDADKVIAQILNEIVAIHAAIEELRADIARLAGGVLPK